MVFLRVFEAFSGVGSQHMALRNLGLDYEVVGVSEIDTYAHQAYEAIHGETKNFGDITKINPNDLPDFDLFTYSFPCTDLSTAGQQRGLERGSGTSSSLLWECQRLIEGKLPKVLLLENVKALLSNKFLDGFHEWLVILRGLGYTTYYGVLNAKDFGSSQNRERVFAVSIRGEHKHYRFPVGFDSRKDMSDCLVSSEEEKKYATELQISRFKYNLKSEGSVHYFGDYKTREDTLGLRTRCLYPSGKVSCLLATDYKCPKMVLESVNFKLPEKLFPSSSTNPQAYPFVEYERGLRESREVLAKDPTVLWFSEHPEARSFGLFNLEEREEAVSQSMSEVSQFLTMRQITPEESWLYMGFSAEDYEKAKAVGLSKLQLYKQAGNSIAVPCLEALFKEVWNSLEN